MEPTSIAPIERLIDMVLEANGYVRGSASVDFRFSSDIDDAYVAGVYMMHEKSSGKKIDLDRSRIHNVSGAVTGKLVAVYYAKGFQSADLPSKAFHVTDSNFEGIIKSNKLVFVDFWANWCGPCRALAPTIEELAKEYNGKVLIGKLDVDENPATAERFQVFSIPTMIVFKDGQEADRLVGLCPKGRIADTLKKHSE